ncbi:BppU family phage baseplate upper protein [Tetragenococcus halophilus]|uniref:BppU family phage baseplate upper protein n=1 Tax=Tetragenococcus halophilus TaxID=51669 RepID=UPI00209AB2ED|nr:BppU family phage baseplate upper protein [Tetragenococcus halophilus]MCO8288318.1 BppU family phage baseplate upper protein [Tetragenococcus halophilus]
MLRKIAEIKVPKGAGPREAKTNPIFATYDRQGAAFAFYFSDSNIAGAAANLLFMVDGQKVFVDDGVTLGETNETHTFTYPLPDKLLNYTGKVDGYLYFDFEDGSHSDEIHFVFTIKKSQIDETMEDAPDVYIKSFEEVKADVQSTADKATSDIKSRVDAVENAKNSTVGDIEKAKDNAESQIGDYVGEIESAKQDISSSASDVQSKASEAGKSIEESSKEVKKAKTDSIKSMSESDISDKNYLLDSKKRVLEERSTGEPTDKSNYDTYYLSEPIPAGTEFTVSGKLEITDGDFDAISIYFRDENGDGIDGHSFRVEHINNGFSSSFTLSKTVYKIYIYAGISGSTEGNGVIYTDVKLQTGPLATPWTPNPQQIVTQDQYDKLANAIINLGGSI